MAFDSAYMTIRMALLGAREAAAEASLVTKSIDGTTAAAERSGVVAATSAGRWTKLSSAMGFVAKWGARAGFVLGGAAAYGIYKSVGAASDLGEQVSKSKQVFGQYAKNVIRWSKTTASSFGISQEAALEYTGTFGNILTAMGFAEDKAGKVSTKLTELAADMASFNNTTPEEALEALRAGLTGEMEPLKKYGVVLSDTRVAQEALGKTATSTAGMTEQEKALARLSLLYKDTDKAQGDFARTAGQSLPNQIRIFKAQIDDLASKGGKVFIPYLLTAVKWLNNLLDDFKHGEGPIADVVDWIKGLGDELDDTIGWLKGAVGAVKGFVTSLTSGKGDVGAFGQDFKEVGLAIKDVAVFLFPLFISHLKRLWSGFKSSFSGIVKVVQGFVKIVGGILRGDWGRVWDGVTDVVSGAVDMIIGAIKTLTAPFRTVFQGIWNIVKGIAGGIADMITGLFDAIKGPIVEILNFVIDRINNLIDAHNALPFVGDIAHISNIGEEIAMPSSDGGLITRGGNFAQGGDTGGVGPHGAPGATAPRGSHALGRRSGGGNKRTRGEPHGLPLARGRRGEGDTVLHSVIELDGKVVAESTARHATDEETRR